MFTGMDHVTIVARDLDDACVHYDRLLGRTPAWRGAHPALGTEAAIYGLANSAIEIVAPRSDAPEAQGLRDHLQAHGEGVLSLTLSVVDASATHRELRARGVRVAPPEEGSAVGPDGVVRTYRTFEVSRRMTRGISVFGVERPTQGALRDPSVVAADSVEALDHVATRTSNPDAVSELYVKGLGLRLALDRTVGVLRMLFFRCGGVTLEFVGDPSLGDEDRFYGLAYRVRDIEAAHARLRANGFNLTAVRDGAKPGTRVFSVRSETHGVPTLFIRDPARD